MGVMFWLKLLLTVLPLLLKWLTKQNAEGRQLDERQAEKLNKALWYMNEIQPQAVRAGCVQGGTPDRDFSLEANDEDE